MRHSDDAGSVIAGGPLAIPRPLAARYLIPITIESGPTSGSTRVAENPAAVIQPAQSAPV